MLDFCKAVKNINKWGNVQEKQSKRVLTRNIFNVPLRLNQRITVSEEEMLRYLLGRNTSVSIREKRSESIKENRFGICGWKILWHLWKILRYLWMKNTSVFRRNALVFMGYILGSLWTFHKSVCFFLPNHSIWFLVFIYNKQMCQHVLSSYSIYHCKFSKWSDEYLTRLFIH